MDSTTQSLEDRTWVSPRWLGAVTDPHCRVAALVSLTVGSADAQFEDMERKNGKPLTEEDTLLCWGRMLSCQFVQMAFQDAEDEDLTPPPNVSSGIALELLEQAASEALRARNKRIREVVSDNPTEQSAFAFAPLLMWAMVSICMAENWPYRAGGYYINRGRLAEFFASHNAEEGINPDDVDQAFASWCEITGNGMRAWKW